MKMGWGGGSSVYPAAWAEEEEAQRRLTEWKSRTQEFTLKGDWMWNTLN